ncbi:MAG: hypothetical protein ABL857_07650 [Rickettsiales bacterium]
MRVSYDGLVIYDSYNNRTSRYYTEVTPLALDGPRQRGLELKEIAESYY